MLFSTFFLFDVSHGNWRQASSENSYSGGITIEINNFFTELNFGKTKRTKHIKYRLLRYKGIFLFNVLVHFVFPKFSSVKNC